MGTGPRARDGYDLAITELPDGRGDLLLEVGSDAGHDIARRLDARPADPADLAAAHDALEHATRSQVRRLPDVDVPAVLASATEHPRWDEVAARCLACANCTAVCPTCFCWSVDDVSGMDGGGAERWRRWDSCFSAAFSYVHGAGAIRASTRSRYRQWLTHKLGTWEAQFGTDGCVGCGRCITWCPVGIDLTEEISALARGTAS
jgi:ferredoxin